jgi:photosystem II stability/assembly factor-like uncharacterized protein/predicted Ser/Thr protein kinase
MIGESLGRYVISGEIGRGGMGVVYRARDPLLNRDVAIKVLGEGPQIDKLGRDHLLHEARAASALSHPNICVVHEVGDWKGRFFIVMELVDGKPLSELISALGMPFEVVTRYGVQIAEALAHAHERGIVHRDLKSSNVAVTTDGRVKVLDFGLARFVETGEAEGATKTLATIAGEATGLTGTLQYMAPEQFRGERTDQRVDIWALGVILYEAASGHVPFRASTTFALGAAILNDALPPLPANIPAGLSAIIQRCLAKDPAVRYQRASEAAAALQAVQIAAVVSPANASGQKAAPTVLHSVHHIYVRQQEALLLVGTTKGAFLLRSSPARSRWEAGGPYFHGDTVYAMAFDGRAARHRLWASTHSILWGTVLRSSDDFGKTWRTPEDAPIRFPAGSGMALKNIWQIALPEDRPEELYCGVEPAAIFASRDAGASWSLVQGLFDHPHRPRWQPGNGGLALHTILFDPSDPNRMYAGISAGGVYRTDDGGATWQARNQGIRVTFSPDKYPEFGQCVHKFAFHPARPERLFLQNHWGLYRSENHGDSWEDIAHGVPSDFGFPVLIHPHDPDCVYVIPVESDEFRCTPEGQMRVYRTRNAGRTWEPLSRGLPQRNSYETVLRDGLAADSFDPTGIYFGTRSGRLYGSRDNGKSWEMILEGLPPIVCVKAAFYGGAGRAAGNAGNGRVSPSARGGRERRKKLSVPHKRKKKSR